MNDFNKQVLSDIISAYRKGTVVSHTFSNYVKR